MSIYTRRGPILAAFCVALLFATWIPGANGVVVLDWDAVTWTPAGNLSNSYDVTGDGLTDVTLTATSQQPNIWTTDQTTGTITPTINQTMTGGLPPVLNS